MDFPNFIRIEREGKNGAKHYVVHMADPKFSMELSPDRDASGKIGKGVIKHICVPNSWGGNYGSYAKLMSAAQDFFAQSFGEPVPKTETRRSGL